MTEGKLGGAAMSPLVWAVKIGKNLDIARMLLDCGANRNILDSDNKSPLYYCLKREEYTNFTGSFCEHEKFVAMLLAPRRIRIEKPQEESFKMDESFMRNEASNIENKERPQRISEQKLWNKVRSLGLSGGFELVDCRGTIDISFWKDIKISRVDSNGKDMVRFKNKDGKVVLHNFAGETSNLPEESYVKLQSGAPAYIRTFDKEFYYCQRVKTVTYSPMLLAVKCKFQLSTITLLHEHGAKLNWVNSLKENA